MKNYKANILVHSFCNLIAIRRFGRTENERDWTTWETFIFSRIIFIVHVMAIKRSPLDKSLGMIWWNKDTPHLAREEFITEETFPWIKSSTCWGCFGVSLLMITFDGPFGGNISPSNAWCRKRGQWESEFCARKLGLSKLSSIKSVRPMTGIKEVCRNDATGREAVSSPSNKVIPFHSLLNPLAISCLQFYRQSEFEREILLIFTPILNVFGCHY